MPAYEPSEVIERLVTCSRCEREGRYRLDLGSGDFCYSCECTSLEIPGTHTHPNGPEIRCATQPSAMLGIRRSRRLLSVGRHGRLFRERWKSQEGIIVQSGPDFVVVPNAEDRQQFWAKSFEQAFTELTGRPWERGEL